MLNCLANFNDNSFILHKKNAILAEQKKGYILSFIGYTLLIQSVSKLMNYLVSLSLFIPLSSCTPSLVYCGTIEYFHEYRVRLYIYMSRTYISIMIYSSKYVFNCLKAANKGLKFILRTRIQLNH